MRVSLFISCLVDQMLPQAGVAVVEVLTRLGVELRFDAEQTCCGQPAFNTGYRREAREVAARTLEILERELGAADYVVSPSGSCVAMVRKHYPVLFADDHDLRARAERVGVRVMEFTEFLVNVLQVEDAGASFAGRVTYHDSCHLLRELGVSAGPRKLLAKVRGAEFVEMERPDVCCGFGGTFAVKFPELSAAMAEEKVACIERSGADVVVACDAGCVLQIAGLLGRRGAAVECLHVAQLLRGWPERHAP